MVTEYTHLELGNDYATGIAGYYMPQQEVRLKYGDREVLYVTGQAVIESGCGSGSCGTGSWGYAVVPGYIVNWQNKRNKAGLPVSDVEPITDEETRNNIKRTIQASEASLQISFW